MYFFSENLGKDNHTISHFRRPERAQYQLSENDFVRLNDACAQLVVMVGGGEAKFPPAQRVGIPLDPPQKCFLKVNFSLMSVYDSE